MLRKIRASLVSNLEVTIQPNHIAVRNLDSGEFAAMNAPFSCGHLIASDIDILEHAANQLLKRTTAGLWSFPRAKVSIPGRIVHNVERKVISDALTNAGASQVSFDPTIQSCDEQDAAQTAYVARAMQKR